MKRQWTLEQRVNLATNIHRWKPWTRSTGPKSPEGKATVARNGWKGGGRPAFRAEMRELRAELKALACFEHYQ